MIRNDQRWGLINSYSLDPFLPVLWEWPVHVRGVSLQPAYLLSWSREPSPSPPAPPGQSTSSPARYSSSEGWPFLVQLSLSTWVKAESSHRLYKKVCHLVHRCDSSWLNHQPMATLERKIRLFTTRNCSLNSSTTDDQRITRLFPQVLTQADLIFTLAPRKCVRLTGQTRWAWRSEAVTMTVDLCNSEHQRQEGPGRTLEKDVNELPLLHPQSEFSYTDTHAWMLKISHRCEVRQKWEMQAQVPLVCMCAEGGGKNAQCLPGAASRAPAGRAHSFFERLALRVSAYLQQQEERREYPSRAWPLPRWVWAWHAVCSRPW